MERERNPLGYKPAYKLFYTGNYRLSDKLSVQHC